MTTFKSGFEKISAKNNIFPIVRFFLMFHFLNFDNLFTNCYSYNACEYTIPPPFHDSWVYVHGAVPNIHSLRGCQLGNYRKNYLGKILTFTTTKMLIFIDLTHQGIA